MVPVFHILGSFQKYSFHRNVLYTFVLGTWGLWFRRIRMELENLNSLKPSQALNMKIKKPKTIFGPKSRLPEIENPIGQVVIEILSFRQKIFLQMLILSFLLNNIFVYFINFSFTLRN